jgi:hypothetical protein
VLDQPADLSFAAFGCLLHHLAHLARRRRLLPAQRDQTDVAFHFARASGVCRLRVASSSRSTLHSTQQSCFPQTFQKQTAASARRQSRLCPHLSAQNPAEQACREFLLHSCLWPFSFSSSSRVLLQVLLLPQAPRRQQPRLRPGCPRRLHRRYPLLRPAWQMRSYSQAPAHIPLLTLLLLAAGASVAVPAPRARAAPCGGLVTTLLRHGAVKMCSQAERVMQMSRE